MAGALTDAEVSARLFCTRSAFHALVPWKRRQLLRLAGLPLCDEQFGSLIAELRSTDCATRKAALVSLSTRRTHLSAVELDEIGPAVAHCFISMGYECRFELKEHRTLSKLCDPLFAALAPHLALVVVSRDATPMVRGFVAHCLLDPAKAHRITPEAFEPALPALVDAMCTDRALSGPTLEHAWSLIEQYASAAWFDHHATAVALEALARPGGLAGGFRLLESPALVDKPPAALTHAAPILARYLTDDEWRARRGAVRLLTSQPLHVLSAHRDILLTLLQFDPISHVRDAASEACRRIELEGTAGGRSRVETKPPVLMLAKRAQSAGSAEFQFRAGEGETTLR